MRKPSRLLAVIRALHFPVAFPNKELKQSIPPLPLLAGVLESLGWSQCCVPVACRYRWDLVRDRSVPEVLNSFEHVLNRIKVFGNVDSLIHIDKESRTFRARARKLKCKDPTSYLPVKFVTDREYSGSSHVVVSD